MKSKTSSVVKGIGVGMLVGGATAIIGSSMMGGKKTNYKKMAQKAIKTAESFMDNMM
jgi:gas vesicle protein